MNPEPKRILVVEDSRTQARRLQDLLDEHGYRTAVAENGQAALDQLQNFAPDLVISDIVMPVMDGYELCRRIKTDAQLASLPVLLLTSLSDPKDVLKGLESRADNFVVKPYEEKLLLARIEAIFENEKLRAGAKNDDGADIFFQGEHFHITSGRRQVLDLLLSTYETAVQKQNELVKARDELREFNEQLELRVAERTAELRQEIGVRQMAEESLSRAKQLLLSVTNGIAENIVLLSRDRRVEWANTTALQSYAGGRAEQIIGKHCFEVFHRLEAPCEESALGCPLQEYRRSGRAGNYTHVHHGGDGRAFHVEVGVYPILDERGEVAQFVHLSRDLTERMLVEQNLIKTAEELRRVDQMKSEFISVASHELRTPLTSINNAVDLMLKRRAGEITGAQENFLSMARRNIVRLSKLINDILNVAKIESGKMELHYREADIGVLVGNVINTMKSLADAKGIELSVEIQKGLPPIQMDSARVEQVLLNLIGNAVKFTGDEGRVTVQARLTEAVGPPPDAARAFLEVAVRDTGIGISAQDLEHVFEKFYQAEDSLTDRERTGTGLGLAISRGLVEKHGGELTCASTVGEGSIFRFTLPLGGR
ncbi:MAG: hybrid sensor histidine kinase/response regulator [Candidatus Methylomirabilia bacterium]